MNKRALAGVPVLMGWVAAAFGQTQPCASPPPADPVPAITSPLAPTDVCIPQNFGGNPIRYFDDYSWRAFVAMIWPAAQGQRGAPDSAKRAGNVSGPVVFETLKQDWELFLPNGAAPVANWNEFGASPCPNVKVGFDDMVLAAFTKFGNLGQAGFGDLVHALPAQNGTWVRYATAFNKSEFDRIVADKLYLRANLPAAGITFADGALDVKSSWIDMTKIPSPERYYTRKAWLKDPVSGTCSAAPVSVGLVGLHIVQKTPSRPQWIWTSFEHVDNVPQDAVDTQKRPFAFNSGNGTPMPKSDPNMGFPPTSWSNPVIFNVDRLKQTPIHPSTRNTNALYRKLFSGTVWQNYQLVLTQWPLVPNSPSTPSSPANTFPGLGATSAFANTTLETWDQARIGTGCMACHDQTMKETDLLWSLQINAFPSTLGPEIEVFALNKNILASKAKPSVAQTPLQKLRALLRATEAANKSGAAVMGKPAATGKAVSQPAGAK